MRWFIVFLLLPLNCFGQEFLRSVVATENCSGVLLENGLLATAKHCGMADVVKVQLRDGQSVWARLVSATTAEDGPVIYRMPPGLELPSVAVADMAPPVGSKLVLAGYSTQASGRAQLTIDDDAEVLGTAQVTVMDGDKPLTYQANKLRGDSYYGSSGGAAFFNGQLAGLILGGSHKERAVSISTTDDLKNVYSKAYQAVNQYPVFTVYTQEACAACVQFKQELASGQFARLPVTFVFFDVGLNPPPADVTLVPCFRAPDGELFRFATAYDGKALATWIRKKLADATPSTPAPPVVVPAAQPVVPVQQSEVVPDLSGIRILLLVSGDSSFVTPMLVDGPIARMIQNASEGKISAESVVEESQPNRFRLVHRALGTADATPHVLVCVLVDEIAEVGFIRGQVLKKIQAKVDEMVSEKEFKIPFDVVFRRLQRETYDNVVRAMLSPDEQIDPAIKTTVTKVNEPVETSDEKNSHHTVAFTLAMAAIHTGRRVWARWRKSRETTDLERQLGPTA